MNETRHLCFVVIAKGNNSAKKNPNLVNKLVG